jgi:lysyl-tRNA synthetase class 2
VTLESDLEPSIDAVNARPLGARVRFGGRVTARDDTSARVEDAFAAVIVEGAGLPEPGALVRIEGVRTAAGVVAGEVVEPSPLPSPPLRVSRSASVKREREPEAFPRAGGEFRAMTDHARLRARGLRLRAEVLRGIRGYFDARGFLEVETPAAVPSPGMDLHLTALEVRGMRAERWLVTSPEYQMKRLLVGGLTRIYQTCRAFRADESGSRHQPEFAMLEWYRAFEDAESVMRDTEALVAELARARHGSPTLPGSQGPIDVTTPWERMPVARAFEVYAGLDVWSVLPDEEAFFRILVDRIEPQLGRVRPVFLTEWPASMASLAQLIPGRTPAVADRFEAFVDGMELCNGFGELTDAAEQRARLVADQEERRRLGMTVHVLDERFLAALEEGMPPSGGNALGIDRLVMLLLGARDLREVIAFPEERV